MSLLSGGLRRLAHWWSGLGIRNSTVVLCVAWLAVFVLYIYVRPEPLPASTDTSVPVVTTPRYAPTYEESTQVTTTTPTSPTVTESAPVDGTETTVAPTTTTGLLDNLVPPFLRPGATSSAPN